MCINYGVDCNGNLHFIMGKGTEDEFGVGRKADNTSYQADLTGVSRPTSSVCRAANVAVMMGLNSAACFDIHSQRVPTNGYVYLRSTVLFCESRTSLGAELKSNL